MGKKKWEQNFEKCKRIKCTSGRGRGAARWGGERGGGEGGKRRRSAYVLDEAVKYNNEDTHTYTHRSTHIHLQTHTHTHTQSSLATPTHLHRNGVLKIMQMNSYSSASPGCLAAEAARCPSARLPPNARKLSACIRRRGRARARERRRSVARTQQRNRDEAQTLWML